MASPPPRSHKVALLHHGSQGDLKCWEETSVLSMYKGLWIGHSPSLNLQCICTWEKSPDFSEADEACGNVFVQKFIFMK